jgi:hypothetical protein
MDNSGPKFSIAVVFMILGIFLFYLLVGYFENKDIYFSNFKGHIVSRGEQRDTKIPFVILSNDQKVYLGSWIGLGAFTLKKSDTLIKPNKSFKVYLKRNGKINDSFSHMSANDLRAKLVKQIN